jgi:hypothetical protein
MRKEIKKLLNPDLVDKWSKEGKLQGIHFNKGDLVSYKPCEGDSLGIVLAQDGIMASVQWTKQPDDFNLQRRVFISSLELRSGVSK